MTVNLFWEDLPPTNALMRDAIGFSAYVQLWAMAFKDFAKALAIDNPPSIKDRAPW